MPERNNISPESLIQRIAVHTHQCFFLRREGHKVELDLGNKAQCAFGTGNQPAEVEFITRFGKWLVVEQQVDGIACIAPVYRFIRELRFYFSLVFGVCEYTANIPVYLAFEGLQPAFVLKLRFGKFSKNNLRTVTQQCFYFEQMITGTTVNQRMRTARVIAYHAANHTAVGGGSFRAEE